MMEVTVKVPAEIRDSEDRIIEDIAIMIYNNTTNEEIPSSFAEFLQTFKEIAMTRKRNWRVFYENGKPILNTIRGILNQMEIQLSDARWGRIGSEIRAYYPQEMTIRIIPKSPYFFGSTEWGEIANEIGDHNSCFRVGGAHDECGTFLRDMSDNVRYLLFEFYDRENKLFARGRCWGWYIPNIYEPIAIMLFNFYSVGIDIQQKGLRLPICHAFEKLFSKEFVVYNDECYYLPVYWNGYYFTLIEKGVGKEKIREIHSEIRYPCWKCNSSLPLEALTYKDGKILCSDCAGEEVFYCESCECELYEDEVYWYDGVPYCGSCFNDRFFYCDKCGEPEEYDYGIYFTDAEVTYCERCVNRIEYYQCDDCGEFFLYPTSVHPITEIYFDDGKINYNNAYFLCNECATYYEDKGKGIICCDSFYNFSHLPDYVKQIVEKFFEEKGCPLCSNEFESPADYFDALNEFYHRHTLPAIPEQIQKEEVKNGLS